MPCWFHNLIKRKLVKVDLLKNPIILFFCSCLEFYSIAATPDLMPKPYLSKADGLHLFVHGPNLVILKVHYWIDGSNFCRHLFLSQFPSGSGNHLQWRHLFSSLATYFWIIEEKQSGLSGIRYAIGSRTNPELNSDIPGNPLSHNLNNKLPIIAIRQVSLILSILFRAVIYLQLSNQEWICSW